MRFHRRFRVRAPLAAVEEFHATRAGFEALAPPLVPMRVENAPERLVPGTTMSFRTWVGPVPIRWTARLEAIEGPGFADVQTEGPFAHWRHEHRFIADGPDATIVDDRIEARLSRQPLRAATGLAMWLGLPVLFAYRARRTRRALEPSPE